MDFVKDLFVVIVVLICNNDFVYFGVRLYKFCRGYCEMGICCWCKGFGGCLLKCVIYVCGCVGFRWFFGGIIL